MDERIERARDLVLQTSDLVEKTDVRTQLQSIAEGLERVEAPTESASVSAEADTDPEQEGDRLEELEAKLAGLTDKTDGESRERVESARNLIDEYRQDRTRDW